MVKTKENMKKINKRPLAVITGASSGIGEVFAKKLGSMGNDLLLISNDLKGLKRVSSEIKAKSKTSGSEVNVELLYADLSKEKDIDKVVKRLEKLNVYYLINNAGFGIGKKFADTNEKAISAMISVHVTAMVRFTRAVINNMIRKNSGRIINISSIAAFSRNRANCVMYNSTKTFVVVFSETLQCEMEGRRKDIRIQALCPGFTITNFHKNPDLTTLAKKLSRAPEWMWMKPEEVVEESLKALDKKVVMCVPGNINKLTVFMLNNKMFSRIPNKIMEGEE
jgi:short-subunit dehydrogenase